MDRRAGMAEQFMTDWQSAVFRDKCATQIHMARCQITPKEDSEDKMERFFAQNSTAELEEFVYKQSKTREEYISLIAEMVTMLRQQGRKSRLEENANSEEQASAGVTAKEQNGESSSSSKK